MDFDTQKLFGGGCKRDYFHRDKQMRIAPLKGNTGIDNPIRGFLCGGTRVNPTIGRWKSNAIRREF